MKRKLKGIRLGWQPIKKAGTVKTCQVLRDDNKEHVVVNTSRTPLLLP